MVLKRTPIIVITMFAVLLLSINGVAAQEPGGGPSRYYSEAGAFTYRASFQLQDGSEIFLLRSAYTATFYSQMQPPTRHHYFSVSVGFYYGKTMLNRPIIQNITFESLSFYPKWKNSAGYSFNLIDDSAIFTVNGTVRDGERLGGFMLIDDNALSQYLPMIGGTYVFKDLSFHLIDGTVFTLGDISIELEKNNNKWLPENAIITGSDDVTYESDDQYAYIKMDASTPLIVFVDLIVGSALIAAFSIIVIALVLHLKGIITLPIERIRSVVSTQEPITAKGRNP